MNEIRLIDANALKEAFNAWKNMDDYYHDTDCVDIPFTEAFDIIDNAPTVEFSKEICSACGRYIREKGGADMRGEKK